MSRSLRKKVIFICKNNAGRSQMAEGLLRHLYGEYYDVMSAGYDPKSVNPLVIEVLGEIGADVSTAESKSLENFQGMEFDYVVTLCGSEKECPAPPKGKKYIYHTFKDPKEFKGTENNKKELFRLLRNEVEKWIKKEFAQDH